MENNILNGGSPDDLRRLGPGSTLGPRRRLTDRQLLTFVLIYLEFLSRGNYALHPLALTVPRGPSGSTPLHSALTLIGVLVVMVVTYSLTALTLGPADPVDEAHSCSGPILVPDHGLYVALAR